MRVSMLQIMSGITELYLDNPCNGRRRMVAYLTRAGDPSKRFDCLVDLKEITAVDQVWATDIT